MSKEITMSISQFYQMERGNMSLSDIIKENDLEATAGRILNNNKLRNFFVPLIALTNMNFAAYAVDDNVTQAMGKVGAATSNIITILQFSIGKVCIIACILEIGKCLIGKRREEIPQIGMKYLIAYLVVKLIPWLFNLIDITF